MAAPVLHKLTKRLRRVAVGVLFWVERPGWWCMGRRRRGSFCRLVRRGWRCVELDVVLRNPGFVLGSAPEATRDEPGSSIIILSFHVVP